MITMTITRPTKKAGHVVFFKLQFAKANFDVVMDAINQLTSTEDIFNNKLWTVI